MKTTLLTGFIVLSGLFVSAQINVDNGAPPSLHYKIVNKIHIHGEQGWDYLTVDEESNTLYVSHGTRVEVIDLKTSKLVDSITGLNGVHGIALAAEYNKGFITEGKDTAVTVFDMSTHKVLAKIKVTGLGPDAIVYDKFTKRIFTMNGHGQSATVIDAKTNAIVGTIKLDGKPEFCVADGKGKLYLNMEDKNAMAEIDANDMKVLRQWSVAPGTSPSGLAMDTKNRKLFSVCDNKMMVVSDADKGKVDTTVTIGYMPDAAAFDPKRMRVYSSNGDGTMTVISDSAGTYKVLENVKTQSRAKTMAINTKTHHFYLPAGEMKPLPPVRAGVEKPKPGVKEGTFVILDIQYMDITAHPKEK
ncbi:MAG TPA: YncE family protein [Bacteroidia bacterium]|nr:YncE family protein [Bacteroidia bacterium]